MGGQIFFIITPGRIAIVRFIACWIAPVAKGIKAVESGWLRMAGFQNFSIDFFRQPPSTLNSQLVGQVHISDTVALHGPY
jgi:hypothetical protein